MQKLDNSLGNAINVSSFLINGLVLLLLLLFPYCFIKYLL